MDGKVSHSVNIVCQLLSWTLQEVCEVSSLANIFIFKHIFWHQIWQSATEHPSDEHEHPVSEYSCSIPFKHFNLWFTGSQGSCSNNVPQHIERATIKEVRIAIHDWQFNWGPEHSWEKQFNDQLRAQQECNLAFHSVDDFFSICEDHTQSGREILGDLRKIAVDYCKNGRVTKDKFLQIFDMLTVVLSEVKFFEVKLDEYAPSIPASRLSSVWYYKRA